MKIHYINFGLAKSATTWIWNNLISCPTVDYSDDKEPSIELAKDFLKYDNYYAHCRVGLNFNTNLWKLDSNQLMLLNQRATHKTIIFRNPYSMANSFYNAFKISRNLDSFIDPRLNYAKILNRLDNQTKVLFYDDIINNPQQFMDNITNYLDIEPIVAKPIQSNKTNYLTSLVFNNKQKILINQYIDHFQQIVDRDISNWKMN